MLHMEKDSTNNTPRFQDPQRRIPYQLFTRTEVNSNPKHWIPFGCPELDLDNGFTKISIWHKYKQWLRIRIYLGKINQFLHEPIYRNRLFFVGYKNLSWYFISLIHTLCRFCLTILRHYLVQSVLCVYLTCNMYCHYDFVRNLGKCTSFLNLLVCFYHSDTAFNSNLSKSP